MQVTQVAKLVNDALAETTGLSAVLNEDLSNVVEVGDAIFNASSAHIVSKNLVNVIGRQIFVIQQYARRAPGVYMDSWEYGSVKQKISFELSNVTENESWELTDGASYDPNVFTEAKANVKYFNKRVTFEAALSITEEMLKQSFSSAGELNAFISGLFTYIDNTMQIAMDNLVMRTINNFMGETISNNNENRYVKLLTLYNTETGSSLTAAQALRDPEFIKYMALTLELYKSRLNVMSTLFNIGGKARYTSGDDLRIVMLDRVKASADVYLQSGVFHNELTALPNAETVPYWQGSGTSYDFDDCSRINIVTATGASVNKNNIIAVMFDRNALGVSCLNKRTTTNYNGKAEFTNYWFKEDAMYFNDTDENGIVFTLE